MKSSEKEVSKYMAQGKRYSPGDEEDIAETLKLYKMDRQTRYNRVKALEIVENEMANEDNCVAEIEDELSLDDFEDPDEIGIDGMNKEQRKKDARKRKAELEGIFFEMGIPVDIYRTSTLKQIKHIIAKRITTYFNNMKKEERPLTTSGLSLALRMPKQRMFEIAKVPEFKDMFVRAFARIEAFAEEALFNKSYNTTGIVFDLCEIWGWQPPQSKRNGAVCASEYVEKDDRTIVNIILDDGQKEQQVYDKVSERKDENKLTHITGTIADNLQANLVAQAQSISEMVEVATEKKREYIKRRPKVKKDEEKDI